MDRRALNRSSGLAAAANAEGADPVGSDDVPADPPGCPECDAVTAEVLVFGDSDGDGSDGGDDGGAVQDDAGAGGEEAVDEDGQAQQHGHRVDGACAEQ